MRNPRRPNRKRNNAKRLVVHTEARATDFKLEQDSIGHYLQIDVPSKFFAPWTPARARSKHWLEIRKGKVYRYDAF